MNLKLKSEIIAPRRLFDWKYFLFVWFVKLFAIYWLINVYWAQPRHFYKASKTPKKLWYNIQKSLDPKSGETGINAVIFSDYPWFLCIVVSIFHFSSSFVFFVCGPLFSSLAVGVCTTYCISLFKAFDAFSYYQRMSSTTLGFDNVTRIA